MNPATLSVLEFDRFLDLLARYSSAPAGRAHIRAIRPSTELDLDRIHNPLFADGMRLVRSGEIMAAQPFESPEAILTRVKPVGACLAAEEVFELRMLLAAGETVRQFLTGVVCENYPALRSLGRSIADVNDLIAAVDKVFDNNGDVRDKASTQLADLRKQQRLLERKINRVLESMMGDLAGDEVLQDCYIVTRNQRFVVPVRRELKSRVKGIIHDQSNSGRTLFIEPEATVEFGNELVRLGLEERDEIRRIIRELSDRIRERHHELLGNFKALIRYDECYAVSQWASEFNCHFANVGATIHFKQARHPLLAAQLREEERPDELVPLSLNIRPDTRVLAITGANTGGKTVVLKTIGLLTLIAQSGLPIPAQEGSQVCHFEAVLADIGDEQSISQNLSTFSAHLTNVNDILRHAGAHRSLVLLDELGSGTDPVEGGALGCAIIDYLAQSKAMAFVTTHLGMIKTYVHEQPHMQSASVQFNIETLQPEYALRIGNPGASRALTIAEKLNVPKTVMERAHSLMHEDHARLESALAAIESDETRLKQELKEAKAARDEILRDQEALSAEILELREERKRLIHEAQKEAASIVETTRREMNQLLKEADNAGRDAIKDAQKQIEKKRAKVRRSAEETKPKERRKAGAPTLEVGATVWVAKMREAGTIVSMSADKKKATVDVGGMRVDVKTKELSDGSDFVADEGPAASAAAPSKVRRPRLSDVPRELNLVGFRVDDALRELERFLDQILLSEVREVRVVHGFGTGALRVGIHEYLRDQDFVAKYRLGKHGHDPGGGGVTIVSID
jgi:DNA mismatch repair protein MutS2